MRHRCDEFDPDRLEVSSRSDAVVQYFSRYPQRIIGIARRLAPVWSFGPLNVAIVLGYDEVREVLSNDQQFPVAWGQKMIEVTEGNNFVLGMKRDDVYRRSYVQLAQAFPRADVATHVESMAAAVSGQILADQKTAGREFDAVQELITAVPTHLCESYFGIQIPDKVLFAKWTLAISSYLFGWDTSASDATLGRAAASCLRSAIRTSIAAAKSGAGMGVVLPRMIKMQRADPAFDDELIHAQLFGMVMGFIPTNVLAGGNILDTLLRRPDFLERTRTAALAGDDDLLWRCLRETLRFRHINLGPWRKCPNGYTFGAGGPRPVRIAPESKVLAIIQSGMFDARRIARPHSFDPDRRDEDYMVFGVGQHWCLGAYIAAAQLTQTFKPLLSAGRLRLVKGDAGRMKRFNIFPLHLNVRIDTAR